MDKFLPAINSPVDLRKLKLYDGSKAERELGITLHTWQEAVLATAASLIQHGAVKKPKAK